MDPAAATAIDESPLADGADRAPSRWVWLETLGLPAAVLALGLWLRPEDPFCVRAEFPWLVMVPMLLGLRYGFCQGLCGSLLLIAAIHGGLRLGLFSSPALPAGASIGLLLSAMLTGEFYDLWARRLSRLAAVSEYRRRRLAEFTRSYHILTVSHASLERRMVESTGSLRESLLDLRRQALSSKQGSGPFAGLADLILALFAGYGRLQVAALHAVDETGVVVLAPAACLGVPPPLSSADPLLARALRERRLTCVGPDDAATDGDEVAAGDLIAAIPLVDAHGQVLAVIAVHQMHFVALQQANLRLLAVLAGHVADLLGGGSGAAEEEFRLRLARCIDEARGHGLPAMALGISFDGKRSPADLPELILGQRRGLDQGWLVEHSLGGRGIFLVMPLSDQGGVESLLGRLSTAVEDRHGADLAALGVAVHSLAIDGRRNAEELIRDLRARCRLSAAAAQT